MQSVENVQRAVAAESALEMFAKLRGETDQLGELGGLAEQNLVDLFTDLAHFCDARDIQMKKCLRLAKMHYLRERGDYGGQFSVVEW